MNKVYVLPPREDWIVDRFVKEWFEDNKDITVPTPAQADVIWLMADWCWLGLARAGLLTGKKVITTVHHIVPEKFGSFERHDFDLRDALTTIYHVYNQRTFDFIKTLTTKPIHLIHYWANQNIWRPTKTKEELRLKHGLPINRYLIGSFQRDTEGSDLVSPKLEKGPDLLADFIINTHNDRITATMGANKGLIPGAGIKRTYTSNELSTIEPWIQRIHVVLGGWRRQYLINRLEIANVPYTYIELPSQEIINELYQTLDLYPVTARHEGGPQALIECGLLNVPTVSRPVGIAEQVLPATAINDDVMLAQPCIPNVEAWKLPNGYKLYRDLIASL
jgi:hypothetical protein